MRVHEGEPIGQAVRRFKKLLKSHQVPFAIRAQVCGYYISDGQERRKKQFKKRLKARLATLEAQQAGVQPVASLTAARAKFQKRTGKP